MPYRGRYVYICADMYLSLHVCILFVYFIHAVLQSNVETGKMSTAVACRRSLVLGQSADLRVLWYDNRPIVATSKPSFRHRDGGHLAGFYVIMSTGYYI